MGGPQAVERADLDALRTERRETGVAGARAIGPARDFGPGLHAPASPRPLLAGAGPDRRIDPVEPYGGRWTVYRRIQEAGPELTRHTDGRRRGIGLDSTVDETHVPIGGGWRYVRRADRPAWAGDRFTLTARRDANAAKAPPRTR